MESRGACVQLLQVYSHRNRREHEFPTPPNAETGSARPVLAFCAAHVRRQHPASQNPAKACALVREFVADTTSGGLCQSDIHLNFDNAQARGSSIRTDIPLSPTQLHRLSPMPQTPCGEQRKQGAAKHLPPRPSGMPPPPRNTTKRVTNRQTCSIPFFQELPWPDCLHWYLMLCK